MAKKERPRYWAVWANRLLVLLVCGNLVAIASFPLAQGMWAGTGACEGVLCRSLANTLTHSLITYLAYGALVGLIAKEWLVKGYRQRVRINLLALLATLVLGALFLVLFSLPALEGQPL